MTTKKWVFSYLAFVCALSAQTEKPIKSPEQIQQELNEAQAKFQHAKELFNPWYAGPLLTGSASMMPPGMMNIQPYIFVTDNYAVFDQERHSVDVPNLWNLNPVVIAQAGITSWLDTVLTVQTETNWKQHHNYTNLGDTTWQLGFKVLKQGLWVPGIKFYLNETFPTGRFNHLKPKRLGVDSTGAGSFVTGFSLNFAKIVFWDTLHPLSLRLSLTYGIPTTVHVRGFNTYGGGFGTRGKVRPGNSFKASLGTEWSFTQRWVIANDVVYTCAGRTTFNGDPGVTSDGLPATVGGGSNDSLSLAPALEYNPNPNLGILGGVWFTVYGRNTSNFISYIFSVTYTFGL
jgi:hypothetical protein